MGSLRIQNKDANSHYCHTEQHSKTLPQICCAGFPYRFTREEKKKQIQMKQLQHAIQFNLGGNAAAAGFLPCPLF